MNTALSQNTFLVKEHVGMFKAANNYDIFNPDSQELTLNCREDDLGFFTKLFRFTDYKRMTPFNITIKTPQGDKVVTIKRGVSIFLSTVEVYDEKDEMIGKFKQKLFSIGGKFDVLDPNDNYLCSLKGKWTSWDFKFIKDDFEFAHVSKKWAGLGKELFTSADNYVLKINDSVPQDNKIRLLILAAVMCIDMVLKE
ncbi:phospholipid scramblase-related protein [Mangrovivirga sp. M17]|uniref:Phospholipid scramblase-related protein n=1 Tax=Mangrovivirga halotolerans TaxID=2993936 RepID=A0ABT3RNH0_9BACT|nr:phospholipid scramblase-related protein [Mangrovivirga halotolerans]MCX2743146.1 phospholipid scramblase-related protein [Mangrovivirga halotolerans]